MAHQSNQPLQLSINQDVNEDPPLSEPTKNQCLIPPTVNCERENQALVNSELGNDRSEQSLSEQQSNTSECENLQCSTCAQSFTSKFSLENHLCAPTRTKHRNNHQCPVCPKVYQYPNQLRIHLLKHNTDRQFQCEHCSKRFKHKNSLQYHQKVFHNITGVTFSCEHCEKVFAVKKQLKRHVQFVHAEVNLSCPSCPKMFRSQSAFSSHLLIHSEQPLQCEHCSELLVSHSELKQHLKVAHPQTFKCAHCSKELSSKAILKRHLKTEHPPPDVDPKPFKCLQCARAFTWRYRLEMHRKHYHPAESTSEPVSCPQCGKSFHFDDDLKRHVQRTHQKKWKCQQCPMKFGERCRLRRHSITRHSTEGAETFLCPICQKVFYWEPSLKRHLKLLHGQQTDAIGNESAENAKALSDQQSVDSDSDNLEIELA